MRAVNSLYRYGFPDPQQIWNRRYRIQLLDASWIDIATAKRGEPRARELCIIAGIAEQLRAERPF